MDNSISIDTRAIADRYKQCDTQTIKDYIEDIHEQAQAKGVSVFRYVKDHGKENITRALLLHRIIDSLDEINHMPSHSLLPDSGEAWLESQRSTSPYLANAIVHRNVIRDGQRIGRLGFILEGIPTWVKPIAGNTVLYLKVNGVEMDYITFYDIISHHRPWLQQYRLTVLTMLKSPYAWHKKHVGELIMHIRNAAA